MIYLGFSFGLPLWLSWRRICLQCRRPGLGRSPGEGKGYPLLHSGLENSMDCIVHGVTKSQTRLSDFRWVRFKVELCWEAAGIKIAIPCSFLLSFYLLYLLHTLLYTVFLTLVSFLWGQGLAWCTYSVPKAVAGSGKAQLSNQMTCIWLLQVTDWEGPWQVGKCWGAWQRQTAMIMVRKWQRIIELHWKWQWRLKEAIDSHSTN